MKWVAFRGQVVTDQSRLPAQALTCMKTMQNASRGGICYSGHLVGGLHHGGVADQQAAVPGHRPHRPAHQDHGARRHAQPRAARQDHQRRGEPLHSAATRFLSCLHNELPRTCVM